MRSNYETFVGLQAIDRKDHHIGTVTDIEYDDGKAWATIDDDFQINLANSVLVLDFITGASYARIGN